MHLRPLTQSDVNLFRDLRLRALREEPSAYITSADEFEKQSLEMVEQRLASTPENFVLGAFIDGQLVGIVGFRREPSTKVQHTADIWGMYVAPEVRRQGVGKALMFEAIDRARSLPGLDHILLGVVASQTAARQLYAALDFIVYGCEPRAVKIGDQYFDEELMVLSLKQPGE